MSAQPDRVDWRNVLDAAGGLAGPANVVMQLAHPAVGHGVAESGVDSGKATLHPLKRARTTGTYLAVAAVGTPEQRAAYRRAVDSVHVQVRSRPGDDVPYNAFDRGLQLWVAACLYKGMVDVWTLLRGPMDDETADAFYAQAHRLGTTLQVRPEMWPPDRTAFAEYWQSMVDGVLHIDESVFRYLDDLIRLRHRPWLVRKLLAPIVVFYTTAFLPPEFQLMMRLPWTPRQQRRFTASFRFFAVVNRLLPGPIRRLPATIYLIDLRIRMRFGRPLV